MPRSSACIRSSASSRRVQRGHARRARTRPSNPRNRPVSRTPRPASVVTSMFRGTGAADELQRGVVARPSRIADRVDRDRRASALLEPPPDVDAPVPAGKAGVAPDRERHVATGRRRSRRRSARPRPRRRRRALRRRAAGLGCDRSGRRDLQERRGAARRRRSAPEARSHHPVAITTRSADHDALRRLHVEASSVRVTASTEVCSCTGASKSLCVALEAIDELGRAVMKPCG